VAAEGQRATTACAEGLSGERLELPVQAQTKFECVANLSKAIDLDAHLQQLSDEVID
jgi:hypothetical protein